MFCFVVNRIWEQPWHLFHAAFLTQMRAQLAKSQTTGRTTFDLTEPECCFQRRRRRDSLEKNSRSDESGEMKRAVDSGFTNKIHLQAVKVWQLWQHKLLLCVFTSPSIRIQHGLWSLPDTRSLARRWAQKAGKFTSDKMFWLWMSDAGTYKAGWTYWD